jgi:hypothetical protein
VVGKGGTFGGGGRGEGAKGLLVGGQPGLALARRAGGGVNCGCGVAAVLMHTVGWNTHQATLAVNQHSTEMCSN